MANPNPVSPPVHGQWKPGQSGNPEGGRIKKRYKQAIERVLAALDATGNPDNTRDKIAAAVIGRAMAGDIAAAKEIIDREDGKVPQAVTGQDGGPVQLIVSWEGE